MISCISCKNPYPNDQTPYKCIYCGGVYDFDSLPEFNLDRIESKLPGIWRYRHTFCLNENAPVVSLGEGSTPLVWFEVLDREIGFKLEFLNPTGSFKDRGTAPLVSFLLSRGIETAIEDSSGNAGASFAAYSASVGIKARIFVPSYASGPKRAQIESYGADIIRVDGSRSKTAEAVQEKAQDGMVYASHVYMPHDILGYATISYELFNQLGRAPGTVIAPAGQGSLLLGINRGFDLLLRAGHVGRIPALIGVQAAACAPLWAQFHNFDGTTNHAYGGETIAEGVRSKNPLRAKQLVEVVRSTNGGFVVVEEEKILSGRDQLSFRGLFVEPTSAIVWDGLSQIVGQVPEPIVAILTGSGLKSF